MTTRREFGRGLAAIIAAGTAPSIILPCEAHNAGLLRGVGARNAMMTGGGGGWANPYVTDGLVAMWDGEWNAGVGVHDSAFNLKIVNLANGSDSDLSVDELQVSGARVWDVGDKCIDILRYSLSTVSPEILSAFNGDGTFEFVMLHGESITGGLATQVSEGSMSGRGLTSRFATNQIIGGVHQGLWRGIRATSWFYYTTPMVGDDYLKQHDQLVYSGTSLNFYAPFDNVARKQKTLVAYAYDTMTRMYINSQCNMRFLCTRVYNRPLTNDELLWNWNLDIERFGEYGI